MRTLQIGDKVRFKESFTYTAYDTWKGERRLPNARLREEAIYVITEALHCKDTLYFYTLKGLEVELHVWHGQTAGDIYDDIELVNEQAPCNRWGNLDE